jgi:hypothetical protein
MQCNSSREYNVYGRACSVNPPVTRIKGGGGLREILTCIGINPSQSPSIRVGLGIIEQDRREVIMRDRTRFHHLGDGECSRGDFN